MESGSVLLLGFLTTDTTRRHPGALDASVIGSYHCYDGPTPDIPACTGVGLPPLYSEEGRQALQLGLRLCAQNDVEIYVKQGKVTPLLKIGLKALVLLVPFRHIQALLRRLL